jgi:hypothetical protein
MNCAAPLGRIIIQKAHDEKVQVTILIDLSKYLFTAGPGPDYHNPAPCSQPPSEDREAKNIEPPGITPGGVNTTNAYPEPPDHQQRQHGIKNGNCPRKRLHSEKKCSREDQQHRDQACLPKMPEINQAGKSPHAPVQSADVKHYKLKCYDKGSYRDNLKEEILTYAELEPQEVGPDKSGKADRHVTEQHQIKLFIF